MSTYKTTCPNCAASFRITTEQLNLREGRARCGSCSQVFQASKYLSPISTTPSNANTSIPSATPMTSASKSTAAPVTMPESASTNDLDSLFDDDDLKRNVSKTQNVDVPDDALIDDNIDIEDDAEIPDDIIGSLGDELSAEFNNTNANFTAITESQVIEDTPAQVTEDEWIEQLLSEDTVESNVSYQPRHSDNTEEPEDLISFLEDIGANTAQFSAIQPHQLTQEMTAANMSDAGNNTAHQPIAPAAKSPSNILKKLSTTILWSVLCAAMLGALAAQYLYFNFDNLARDTSKRQLLASVCDIAGCTVPDINSDNVTIAQARRSADDANPQWSRVKFVLQSKAKSAMLLPNIKVTLLNRKGNVVGENIIQPDDYLISHYKRLPHSQHIDADILIKKPLKDFSKFELAALY